MLFWILILIIAILSILGLLYYIWIMPKTGARDTQQAIISTYKQQLSEIDQSLRLGLLLEADAMDQKKEIARRLLLIERSKDDQALTAQHIVSGAAIKKQNILLSLLIVILLPAVSFGTYYKMGNPNSGDWPLMGERAQRLAAIAADPQAALNEMKIELQENLDQNPQIPENWAAMATHHLRLNQPDEAVKTIEQAAALFPENANIITQQAEIYTLSANGFVTPQAQDLFYKAIELEPDQAKPYFYIAEGEWQRDNHETALSIWKDLIDNAPNGAPWLQFVTNRFAQANQELMQAENAPAPNQQTEAFAAMNAQQQEMVLGMVSGLEERLAEDPDDQQGWQRLIRSYQVLGDAAAERTAITGLLAFFDRQLALTPEQQQLSTEIQARLQILSLTNS